MSKFKDEFDSITPPDELRERVKNAVRDSKTHSASRGKRPQKRLGFQKIAAIAAAFVLIISMAVIGILASPNNPANNGQTSEGGQTNKGRQDLVSFGSTEELNQYVMTFMLENSDTGERPDESSSDGGLGLENELGNEHSTTNNQTEGVEEADIVHTDGNYIYTLGYDNISIVRADDLSIAANIIDELFFPDSMFLLKQEKLLVVLGKENQNTTIGGYKDFPLGYYYWCAHTTVVRVYDINLLLEGKNEAAIKREIKFTSTNYNSARMIDGILYLVLSSYNFYGNQNVHIPETFDSKSGEFEAIPAENIYLMPGIGRNLTLTVLAGVDITKDGDLVVDAFVGSFDQIYASKKAVYIAFTEYKKFYYSYQYYGKTYTYYRYEYYGLRIVRFEIDVAWLKYVGDNLVDSYLVNQFAMDEYTYGEGEYEGKTFFRIATTLYGNYDSRITVFDDEMNQVGLLEGLGEEWEQIYSVRFSGEKAVVVTFMQTDPLYVIDLSDPAKPIIQSELKIHGVSDYLHFLKIKGDYVFAVGRRQSQSGGWLEGLKVSLFDISGTEAAREVAYFEVGTGYSSSEATYNHKAIMYFMPSGGEYESFAFAANWYDYGYDLDGHYYSQYYSALYYYSITSDGEMTQTILDYDRVQVTEEYYGHYYSYYTDSLRRSVVIGENIYLIGYYGIQRYSLNDFSSSEYVSLVD